MHTQATLTAEGHPTRAAVQRVIDRLKRQAPASKVEMGLPYIFRERDGACLTVACHAGHYVAACLLDPDWHGGEPRPYWRGERWGEHVVYEGDREMLYDGAMRRPLDYSHGARMLALDLGFGKPDDAPRRALEAWARANPEIWGNSFGAQMFGAVPYAFAVDDEARGWQDGEPPALTLAAVLARWEHVHDHLPEEPEAWDAVRRMAMHFDAAGLFPHPIR